MKFEKGDRVVRPLTPGKQKSVVGTYVGESRDGVCHRVRWDGTSKVQSIVKGHIRKVEEVERP